MNLNNQDIIFVASNEKAYKKMIEKYKKLPYYKYAISDNLPQFSNNSKVYYFTVKDSKGIYDIGYLVCYKPNNLTVLWIQSLVIFEPYTRQRYGTKIINYLIGHFSNDPQLKSVYLTCYRDNIIGLNFWHSLGFEDVTLHNKEYNRHNNYTDIAIFKKNIQRSS